MDRVGEYKLAIQIGQRGFYARVWLTTSPDPSSDSLKTEVARDVRDAPMDLQAAVKLGIESAWAKARRADPSHHGLLVQEVRLHYMVVDSTPKCAAYAAAAALLKALGLEELLPAFQPNKTFEEMMEPQPGPSQEP